MQTGPLLVPLDKGRTSVYLVSFLSEGGVRGAPKSICVTGQRSGLGFGPTVRVDERDPSRVGEGDTGVKEVGEDSFISTLYTEGGRGLGSDR